MTATDGDVLVSTSFSEGGAGVCVDNGVVAGMGGGDRSGNGTQWALLPPAPTACGSTSRYMVIRSRVSLQRTPRGVQGVVPPNDVLPVSHLHSNAAEVASDMGRKSYKSTHLVGEGPLQMPVEVSSVPTSSWPSRMPCKAKLKLQQSRVLNAGIAEEPGALRSFRQARPLELTQDLRQELKLRLNSLQSSCRADFQMHPRSLRFFLKELQDICELLEMPLPERRYRQGHRGHVLHHFVRLVPQLAGNVELPPASGELPRSGFLTVTALLALTEAPWDFSYNSLRHRVCNCGGPCLAPAAQPRPGGQARAQEPGAQALRRRERHFPVRLLELSGALRARFLDFAGQTQAFLDDFMCISEHPAKGQEAHAAQTWERYALHILSEVSVLDRYYTQFEQLYLGLVDRMIGAAVEPVHAMVGPSGGLLHHLNDPFRELQAAVLCQRLGLLKQHVDFGGQRNLLFFDPGLLQKARRVLHMDTYKEVSNMARELLAKFEALCKVLVEIRNDQLKPELRENVELRAAVLGLEAIWSECQFVLQQGSLDFIRQLLDFLPHLAAGARWQLRMALLGEEARVPPEEQVLARMAFFETLPMLLYLEELWHDVSAERGLRELGACCRFRELFCPADERHQTLRRDLSKFDEPRFAKLRSALLGEAAEEEVAGGRQARYLGLLQRQLRELAAFPAEASPEEALRSAAACTAEALGPPELGRPAPAGRSQARARWVCVLRVARDARPELFPPEPPSAWRRARHQRASVASPPGAAQQRRLSLAAAEAAPSHRSSVQSLLAAQPTAATPRSPQRPCQRQRPGADAAADAI